MTHYIYYLNKDNGFRKTEVSFDTYEEAADWGRKNLEKFNPDMVTTARQDATVSAVKSTITFEVYDGNGWIGKDSKYNFDTAEEAEAMAVEFKNDPRSHNPNMEDSNVKYWKDKNYTIIKKTIITEEIKTV